MPAIRQIRPALVVLLLLHAVVVFAGFLAPYDYAEQHRAYPYAPPSRIHFQPRPVVFGLTVDSAGEYREDPQRVYRIRFFVGGHLFGVDSGGVIFLAGTDGYGRDVFSRVLYGGRVSLATGIVATILALVLGWIWGVTAGF